MKIIAEDCIACGMCQDYCPSDAIQPITDGNQTKNYLAFTIDENLCVDCGECLECGCPGRALVNN